MQGPMVVNPLYEGAEDHYEHLPEPQPVFIPAILPVTYESGYSDVGPSLPPRKNEESSATDAIPGIRSDKLAPKHFSLDATSANSMEDCYTIMSPSGTVTVLPRNQSSYNIPNEDNCVLSSETKNT